VQPTKQAADAEGAFLGYSTWDATLLRECGGNCFIASYADVCALLLAAARENGAMVRFAARVEAVHEEEARVTLVGGEVVEADIIVGADGIKGLMRKAVLEQEEDEDEDEDDEPTGSVLFK
jgi:salicylate hydroxylase